MSWLFGRKKKLEIDKPPTNWTEIHCHILPGIDDGSPDVETSIILVKGLIELGCNHIVATPHIIGDMYRNDFESISNAAQKLISGLETNGITIRIDFAAEYMMDDYFMSLLKKSMPLLTYKDNYILTEFSYAIAPNHVEEITFEMITQGYKPILAHPERYGYFHHDYDEYIRLKELGFSFQINMLSILGYYGKEVKKAADFLIKEGLIDFAGSDIHHLRHLDALPNSFSMGSLNSSLISNNLLLLK